MNILIKAAFVAALIVMIGIAGHFDVEDANAQHETYCTMVAIWKAEAARGVPASNRTGWPPYDGECTK